MAALWLCSYPHEAFTSDGTGAGFSGTVKSSTATSIVVPEAASAGYIGGALAVLAGQGQGQLCTARHA